MPGLLVLKFGGASLASAKSFDRIADLIIEKKDSYSRLVIVVSAMQSWTDQLLQLSYEVHPNPPRREQDMLISAGERISMALLAMALEKRGVKAISLTGSQSGIITNNDHSNACILDIKPHRIEQHLQLGQVVIVAGFQGVSFDKEVTTLGRGGSDTTAVALAVALEAEEVIFYKDVPGIFAKDPKKNFDQKPFSSLNYNEALEIVRDGAKVLHERSLLLAKKNRIALLVRSFNDEPFEGTRIQDQELICQRTKIYEDSIDL